MLRHAHVRHYYLEDCIAVKFFFQWLKYYLICRGKRLSEESSINGLFNGFSQGDKE